MDITILANELAKPEYAELTDQQAADAVNAKTVPVRVLVETWRVKQYAIEQGIWGAVKIASKKDGVPDSVKALCISLIDWIDDAAGKIQTVNMDLMSVQYMLSGLVQAGLATQEQVVAILALADSTIAWTQSVGIETVGDGHVKSARGLN